MDLAWGAMAAASILFILGATSPGPSLMIVVRNTMIGGRKRGIACGIGHGIGFGIYCMIAVFGLIFLIEQMPIVFSSMQLASSIFLAYLAYSLWIAEENTHLLDGSHAKGFSEGFLFAFLNPKIALFMLAVLSSVLEENMSMETKLVIGFLGFFFDIAWYVIVATFLSSSLMINRIQSKQLLMNKITALVMMAMAVWVWARFVI